LVDDLAQLGASSYCKRKHVSPKAKDTATSTTASAPAMTIPASAVTAPTSMVNSDNVDDDMANTPPKRHHAASSTTDSSKLVHTLATVKKRSYCAACNKRGCGHICLRCTADAETHHQPTPVYLHKACYWNHHPDGQDEAKAMVAHYS